MIKTGIAFVTIYQGMKEGYIDFRFTMACDADTELILHVLYYFSLPVAVA